MAFTTYPSGLRESQLRYPASSSAKRCMPNMMSPSNLAWKESAGPDPLVRFLHHRSEPSNHTRCRCLAVGLVEADQAWPEGDIKNKLP